MWKDGLRMMINFVFKEPFDAIPVHYTQEENT